MVLPAPLRVALEDEAPELAGAETMAEAEEPAAEADEEAGAAADEVTATLDDELELPEAEVPGVELEEQADSTRTPAASTTARWVRVERDIETPSDGLVPSGKSLRVPGSELRP